jgi:hypothetical protein
MKNSERVRNKQSTKTSDQANFPLPPGNLRFTLEFRLVAACSWIPESVHAERQNHFIDTLSNSKLNWDEVISLVLRHGVVGPFCTVMGKRGWGNVPFEIRERLKSCRTQHAVRALGQVAELTRVGRLYADAGVPLIPLKGVALSQELYGDPCVRSSCDLDILVKLEDVEKAELLLIQAGYRNALGFHTMSERQRHHIINTLHHHEYIHDAKGVHIELHWRSYLWSQEQIDTLWNTCRVSIWLDAGLMRLSAEENILFLADHGARHDWSCLKWLSDVAMLVQNMPDDTWLSLYNRAAFFDLQKVVCQTVTLLEWFYGIEPPQAYRDLSVPNAIVQNLSVHAASHLLASGDEFSSRSNKFLGLRMALLLKQLKPATPLSALLGSVMIIPADFVELPLPDYLFWLYLPLRPYFWFKRHYLKKAKC